MPKSTKKPTYSSSGSEDGYYITKASGSYHREKSCASRGGGSNCFWYADAHEARNAAQDRFDHKVTRCGSCCE